MPNAYFVHGQRFITGSHIVIGPGEVTRLEAVEISYLTFVEKLPSDPMDHNALPNSQKPVSGTHPLSLSYQLCYQMAEQSKLGHVI